MSVSYHEGRFPPKKLDWEIIAPHLAMATLELARYDSFLGIIPDPNILLSPMLVAEAATSSRIEGTRATTRDVLAFEAGVPSLDPEKRNDIQEVINYREAVGIAESMMTELPLTGRVLRAAHERLLYGVRGHLKSPGRYRTDQNWIGTTYDIDDARYIPPKPEAVEDAMKRWEEYVNDPSITTLVRTAVAHAEFESVHPFNDGNGRIGRIVIPLMLQMDGVTSKPCFYLSEFFEHRNTEYQDKLLEVSRSDAWTDWCVFFLDAITTQAKENHRKASAIFDLYNHTVDFLLSVVKPESASLVAPHLFSRAIFPSTLFTKEVGLTATTAKRLVKALKDSGVVVEVLPHSGRSPAVLAFPELLEVVDGISIRADQ